MPLPLLTDRLDIDLLQSADIDDFVRYRQNPDVARFQSWTTGYSVDDATSLVAGQPENALPAAGSWAQLAIRARNTSGLLGDVAIHRLDSQPDTFEIGMTLAPASQHRGIATEAVLRVLEFLFTEAHTHRVIAECDARNEPVARLLAALGMRRECHQLEADYFKGEWTTLDTWAILRREFATSAPVVR